MKKKGLSYQDQAGFKVPEGYFQEFEARMMEKIASEKMEEPAPENPFKVPEDYFDNFQDNMMQRLKNDGLVEKEVKVVPLGRRKMWSYVAGIAAVLAVVFSSVVLKDSRQATFDELDVLAVENYILESFEFESTTETPLFEANEIEFAISSNPEIEREALLEYLKENIEEPALLLNEE